MVYRTIQKRPDAAASPPAASFVMASVLASLPVVPAISQESSTVIVPEFVGAVNAVPILATRNAVDLASVILLGAILSNPAIGEVTMYLYNPSGAPSALADFTFTFAIPAF